MTVASRNQLEYSEPGFFTPAIKKLEDVSMYDVNVEIPTFLQPRVFVVQCAWCKLIMSGPTKGEVTKMLLPYATHGCCKECSDKALRTFKRKRSVTSL